MPAPTRGRAEYEVSHDAARQRFIIVTNQGAAVDFKIMTAPVSQPENWDELMPHQTGQLILDAIAFENHLAIFITGQCFAFNYDCVIGR